MSNYPSQIDILPTVVPNAPIALVPGSVLNAYSAAISNIENTVGIDPAGPYTNVSERFSVLENVIGNIKINLSVPSSPFTYDHTDLSGSLNIDGTINNVSRPTVIGIQGYPVSSAAPDLYNVLTWNGIAWEPLPIITLQGRPVSATAPTTGYVLTWTGSTWAPAPSTGGGGGGGSFVAGGDLSGIATFQTVIGLQNRPVSSTVPTSGQVLEYVGSSWTPTTLPAIPTSLPPNGPAGGDLSGTYPNPKVAAIQGNPIQTQTLGVGQDGYTLVWNGTTWLGEQGFSGTAAGGDLSADYPNPVVAAVGEVKIPIVSPSNPTGTSGFVIGNFLQVTNVTANNATLGYGELNLSSNVSGTLSNSFQQPQSVGNNLSGTTNNAVVIKIQNIPVENTSLGLSQDGYVLTYVNSAGQWEPQPSTTGASLAGDITGSVSATNVAKLQGNTLTVPSPSNGQFLEYNGSAWVGNTISAALAGDVTASSTALSGTLSTSVVKIQGNSVKSQSLGSAQDGYILTWINNDGEWEAIPNGGGSGAFVAGGDLSGSSVDQTVIKINGTSVPASPSANEVLVASSGTSATWSTIVNSNISSGAGITGSKIDFSFATGGITSIYASNTIEAGFLWGFNSLSIGAFGSGFSAAPTITVGSGVPSSTPPDGSIYLRTDGASDGTESIYSYEVGAWVPVGSAAAGVAGGDLFGSYPNPEVTGLLNHPLPSIADGYLNWNGSAWLLSPISSGGISALTGDVTASGSGSVTATVVGIDSVALSISSLNTGNNLVYNGTNWINAAINLAGGSHYITGTLPASNLPVATNSALGVIELSNDLGGTDTAPEVIGLLNHVLPSLTDGYLFWSGSAWELLAISGGGGSGITALTGDVSASGSGSVAATVTGIDGVTLNISSLNTGNALQYNGSDWINGPINLAGGSHYITGTLPSGNQAAQTMGGDVTGTTAASTVAKLQGNAVESQSLGLSQDGYVLTWNHASNFWYAAESSGGGGGGGFTAGGDLEGTSTDQTVIGLQTVPISSTTPIDGYVLTYNGSEWAPAPSSGAGSSYPFYSETLSDIPAQGITIFAEEIVPEFSLVLNAGTDLPTEDSFNYLFPNGQSFVATIQNRTQSILLLGMEQASGTTAAIITPQTTGNTASITNLSSISGAGASVAASIGSTATVTGLSGVPSTIVGATFFIETGVNASFYIVASWINSTEITIYGNGLVSDSSISWSFQGSTLLSGIDFTDTLTTISASTSDYSIFGSGADIYVQLNSVPNIPYTNGQLAGQYATITITGATNPGNNGTFSVSSLQGNGGSSYISYFNLNAIFGDTFTYSIQYTSASNVYIVGAANPSANGNQFLYSYDVNFVISNTATQLGTFLTSDANNGSIGWRLISGNVASITFSSGTVTLSNVAGMEQAFVGDSITISGAATAANNGIFPIANIISPSSVTITNPEGVTDSNNGLIIWASGLDNVQGLSGVNDIIRLPTYPNTNSFLTFSGAENSGNNGTFQILGINAVDGYAAINGSTLVYPDGYNGSIHWTQFFSELAIMPYGADNSYSSIVVMSDGTNLWSVSDASFIQSAEDVGTILSGGLGNTANSAYSSCLGGQDNTAGAEFASCVGGAGNSVNDPYGAIIGGNNNTVSASNSGCFVGNDNNATSTQSACIAGQSNTINSAYSVIVGGINNTTNGNYSVAMGYGSVTSRNGQTSESSGNIPNEGVVGDSQYCRITLNGSTLGIGVGETVNLSFDTQNVATQFGYLNNNITDNKTYSMFLEAVAENTGNGDRALFSIQILAHSDGTAMYLDAASAFPNGIFTSSAGSPSTSFAPQISTVGATTWTITVQLTTVVSTNDTLSFTFSDGISTETVWVTAVLRWIEQGNY